MAEHSKIQWTDHTFNPWRGCARVSPGCVHCYAETLSKRNPKTLGTWGVDGTRVVASEAMWKQPLQWDADAERRRKPQRVFCASLADVGEDRPDLVAPRQRLSRLIQQTPWLDWLLLTKRPENMTRLFAREVLERCWVGTTCENQEYADKRIPLLSEIPAKVRFVSAEPLIGPIDFSELSAIDWVIFGGESGGGARVCSIDWIRSGVRQCRNAEVAPFVKQLGKLVAFGVPGTNGGYQSKDLKGGDPSEWPEPFPREFPVAGHVASLNSAKLERDR